MHIKPIIKRKKGIRMSKRADLIPTGINGFDGLLGGGIPKGHIVSVFGGPGSGKTIFCMQFLYNGATQYNEPGIYVSLDESPSDIKRHMSVFGWDLEDLEKKKKLAILDMTPYKHLATIMKTETKTDRTRSLLNLGNVVKGTVERIGAERVVVDPMSTLVLQYPEIGERRLAIMDLLRTLKIETNCTSLMTLELRATALEREYQLEEYLTQGAIILQTATLQEIGLTRVIYIEKMRGIEHDTQPHPYTVTNRGIEVFSREKVYAALPHRT